MGNTKCSGVAIALALIFGVNNAAANVEHNDTLSVRPFEYVPSLDTASVLIRMRGARWQVPRNFLETATLSRPSQTRGWLATLRMVTTLSTMGGAIPATLRCFKTLQTDACSDGILVFVNQSAASAESWNRQALIEAASDPRDDFYGLTYVKAQVSLGRQDVYVFYGGSFDQSQVIACRQMGAQGIAFRLQRSL